MGTFSAAPASRSSRSTRRPCVGRVVHVFDADELDAWAAHDLSQDRLVRIDRLPAFPLDGAVRPLGLERGLVEGTNVAVLEDLGDRVGGVLLVGADHARGAALDPPDHVLAPLPAETTA